MYQIQVDTHLICVSGIEGLNMFNLIQQVILVWFPIPGIYIWFIVKYSK